jgi:hypothetical protein
MLMGKRVVILVVCEIENKEPKQVSNFNSKTWRTSGVLVNENLGLERLGSW